MDNLKGRVKCLGPSFVISAGSLHSTFNLSYLTIPVEESDKFHKGCKQSGKSPRIWAPTCLGGGGGYSHTLPIQVCAAQRGRDFEAPDLEWGIHFRGVF